jgi:ketosteroid isomerase-like protein
MSLRESAMTQPHSPEHVFLALVNGVAAGGGPELADLYAEHTDVTHPFDPFRAPALRTRAELREHFTNAPGQPSLRRQVTGVTIHNTSDPEVIVAEFAYQGTRPGTAEPFTIPCVFVLRVRDGRIVESRDYIDPIAAATARNRLPDLLAALTDR